MTTEYRTREPRGFGNQPFGRPTTKEEDKEFKTDGFGDPKTKYSIFRYAKQPSNDYVGNRNTGISSYCLGGAFEALSDATVSNIYALVSGLPSLLATSIMKVFTFSGSQATLLATSDVSATLPLTPTWTGFVFSTPFSVSKGTDYMITVNNETGSVTRLYYNSWDGETIKYVNDAGITPYPIYNVSSNEQSMIFSSGVFGYKKNLD